ncbi:MAG: SDR family NAD(P)-dependent oxidoreductase [Acidobacteriota bacterium]
MQIDLRDRVALVTGASRGIGRATAEALAACGAAVAVHYHRQNEAADEVVGTIVRQGGDATAVAADVRDGEAVKAMMEAAIKRWGRLDILICNAGIWKEAAIDQMEEVAWNETIDINLKGIYLCTRHALPHMIEGSGGAIVNVSSTAGQRGEPYHAHYAASKGGIIAWTKALAVELANKRIRVNAVAPGWIETDMAADVLASEGDSIFDGIPLRRAGQPHEIAAAICFLASELASYITGEILNVNGGNVLCG